MKKPWDIPGKRSKVFGGLEERENWDLGDCRKFIMAGVEREKA